MGDYLTGHAKDLKLTLKDLLSTEEKDFQKIHDIGQLIVQLYYYLDK